MNANDAAHVDIVPVTTTAPIAAISPVERMIQFGMEHGQTPEALAKLYDLYERERADARRREYNEAMMAFQSECPLIRKVATAKVTKDGVQKFTYQFAPIEEVLSVAGPIANKHGFSWDFDSKPAGNMLTVSCRASHRGGHSETREITLPVEGSPAMSGSQKVISTRSFGRRNTFLDVFGLGTCDPDDDGRDGPGDLQTITHDQAMQIEDLLADTGANVAAFKRTYGIERISDLPVSMYEPALAMLELKAKK